MERSANDKDSVIKFQKEQLSRYETRLKDVVTAYKGLLKEKEALEATLITFKLKEEDKSSDDGTKNLQTSPIVEKRGNDKVDCTNEDANLKTQVHTLMNSLATLSAEKSRMEASFQADKKQLRAQIKQKDALIDDLQIKINDIKAQSKKDIEEVKSKWIMERQEHDKEMNNQILMIRELQKLFADEKNLRENIEMQLNNFKAQFASNESKNSHLEELQRQLKEAYNQLKVYKEEAKQFNKDQEKNEDNQQDNNDVLLQQLQEEMHVLKEQHAVAIKMEQQRVKLAEEQSRNQEALHENRVVNLEARLAELSATVGNYDRLRQKDQKAILALKKQLQDLEKMSNSKHNTVNSNENVKSHEKIFRRKNSRNEIDLAGIVDEILYLKKILLKENAQAIHPIDLTKLFTVGQTNEHIECEQELRRTLGQLQSANFQIEDMIERIKQQKNHIGTLQDKVQVLNSNIEKQELELERTNEKIIMAIKEERSKWKKSCNDLETEYRCKVNDLEEQLQKQRQRSLQLLEEKEQEIKTLKTSIEIFHNNHPNVGNLDDDKNANHLPDADDNIDNDNDSDKIHSTSSSIAVKRFDTKTKRLSLSGSCHMLHYDNEIARKDIEIANLRKAKYVAETSMRKAIQNKVTIQEELENKISSLKEEVDRLERCKTREGANLEYLKNVIISYIVSKDPEGRRHMMNAISAVLQFTPAEMHTINAEFNKK